MSAKPDGEVSDSIKKFVAEQYADKISALKELHSREIATYTDKVKKLEDTVSNQCSKIKELEVSQNSLREENKKLFLS